MSRNLLMVTSAFPYGQGESFIDAELRQLSGNFERITVVPCFVTSAPPSRKVAHEVDVSYAQARWGRARVFHVASSFLRALWRYRWLDEAALVCRKPRRLENFKELARSLYRAGMFEQFLEHEHATEKRADLVYFYWVVPEIEGALAYRRLSKRPGARALRIVARAHGGDLYEEGRLGGYAGFTRSILAGLDAVYCISLHGKRYLQVKYPSLASKVHLARLGVGNPGFTNPQPEGDGLSILSCSFMVPGKRLHLIVMALELLLRSDPGLSIRWTHIGDGELFEQLKTQVGSLLSGRRIEVEFKGYMKQPELVEFYRKAPFDVIVNVSDTEGIPVSLMEASSVGIPMVATDVGGSSEIVNSSNGVLIDADADVSEIAAAILRFREKSRAVAARRSARDYCNAHFDATTNYSLFGQLLLDQIGAQ